MNTKRKIPQDETARWLRRRTRPDDDDSLPSLRAAELFCGCGGMTLGLEEALRREGLGLEVALAVDTDPTARRVYAANFPEANVVDGDVAEMFPGKPGDPLSKGEKALRRSVGPVDILDAGPPCQGHSDLNNRTRRRDPRNALYSLVARAAEVLEAEIVVIENVPPVEWDADDVVGTTQADLERLGYRVAVRVVDASRLGVPQSRKRSILVASRLPEVDPAALLEALMCSKWPVRDVEWAIADLVGIATNEEVDRPTSMSEENKRRVDVLFDGDLYDLPDPDRPRCHREKKHSYRSVYGRLRWDRPAQTITTGFTSMGQGRYVHPSERRTITPHEAARLQTFPDWFDWGDVSRTKLAMLVGNAVPPVMMVRLGALLVRAMTGKARQSSARA